MFSVRAVKEADDQVVAQLESTLVKLKEVANSEKIDEAGVDTIFSSTSDVLKFALKQQRRLSHENVIWKMGRLRISFVCRSGIRR